MNKANNKFNIKTTITMVYQPYMYFDDGTNIDYNLPSELNSFDVFQSADEAGDFMIECGYADGTFVIQEFEDDEIEEFRMLDRHGDPI